MHRGEDLPRQILVKRRTILFQNRLGHIERLTAAGLPDVSSGRHHKQMMCTLSETKTLD
jgi:hypothetical protein